MDPVCQCFLLFDAAPAGVATRGRAAYAPLAAPSLVLDPFLPTEIAMLLVREIMDCKPGKVRPLVEKFLAMSKLSQKPGPGSMRVMTDLGAERDWTVVSEMAVPSLQSFEQMLEGTVQETTREDAKEFEKIMAGDHDRVDSGRREISRIEA